MTRKLTLLFTSTILLLLLILAPSFHSVGAVAPTLTPVADDSDHWALEDIYPDYDAWEKDFTRVEEIFIPGYQRYEGKLGDAEKFLELMEWDVEASRMADKLYVYAYMKMDEDQTDSQVIEMAGRVSSLYGDLYEAGSYVSPELIDLPEDTLEAYLEDEKLADYHMLLQRILKRKAHTLSKEEEAILAQSVDMSQAANSIATKIREADLQFPTIQDPDGNDIELSEANFVEMLMDPDRQFREEAFMAMMNTYGSMKYSLAAALDAQMRTDSFFATARKYDSALEASLESNNIPEDIYMTLLKSTDNNIDSLHRYVTLRKQVLNIDSVKSFDMYISLVTGYSPREYPYDEAKLMLNEALSPLGEAYLEDMQIGLESGWIDVYPSENKTSGAYSWGSYDTHPYILLNFNGSVGSVLTLAHEMGHAMNSYYTHQSQPYYNSDIAVFNAEVASTTNELLVLRYWIDHAEDDEERLYYLDRLADTILGTFYVQVMLAEFEWEIHDRVESGEALSVDSLNEMWSEKLVKYYGPDYEVIDETRLSWSSIPHFYYDFYVYQYATGIAAANMFASRIADDTPGAVDQYLEFLSAGSSDYPIVLLQNAGIDMSTSEPVDILLDDFEHIVEEMESILLDTED